MAGDEACQGAGIGEHPHGIFAGRRERHQLAAGGGELPRQAPCFGRHQCAAAGPYEGVGDLDDGKFRASAIQARDDLQYGWAVLRQLLPPAIAPAIRRAM